MLVNFPHCYVRTLTVILLVLLTGSCDLESVTPIVRKTDVIIKGRIMTDGGAAPMPDMEVTLFRDEILSPDISEFHGKTDANGYFYFKFKANHELHDRQYWLQYYMADVDQDKFFCPANQLPIGNLPSADTTLVYNFLLPRKTEIKCVYKDPAKASEYELNTIFRFTCGLESISNQFQNETGAVSMDYTENPLYIPANTPVIVVTRGIDRKLSKPLEKQDTIVVAPGSNYMHQIDL